MPTPEKKPALSAATRNASLHFISAATGALVSKSLNAPLERLRLLLQNQNEIIKTGRLNKPYKGVIDCTRTIFKTEGLLSFWKGNVPGLIAAVPNNAIQFAVRGMIKDIVKPNPKDTINVVLLKNLGPGAATGVTTLFLLYSLNYCRVRLANDVKSGATGERQFKGMVDVYRKTLASDGITGLYRGFVVSCVGIAVYRGFYFGLYDTLKPKDSGILASMVIGFGTSITAGVIAYPFDTIRCRMLMRSIEPVKYKGFLDCATQIIRNEGLVYLWRGVSVNIFSAIAGAMVLVGYDTVKFSYRKRGSDR